MPDYRIPFTAVALILGAPCWFDVLQKLVRLVRQNDKGEKTTDETPTSRARSNGISGGGASLTRSSEENS